MAAELLQHDAKAPVALFDNIPGYPKGFRVLTNFFGGRRQNMTLGFSPDLNKIELSEAFLRDFQQISDKPLPYEVVESGPVMENVIEGEAIDVTRFPTPVWHDRDEGRRYIGTGSFNVTRDPEDGWVNAGTYRVMIHDAKRLGFYISPGKHGRIHRDKYQARNEPMPVCIVIGGDPLTFLMACTEVPFGTCEFEIAGAYRGRPQKVVIGKHTGLPFPANAEIVLEGFVQPGNMAPEDRDLMLGRIGAIMSHSTVPGTSAHFEIYAEFLPLAKTDDSKRLFELYTDCASALGATIYRWLLRRGFFRERRQANDMRRRADRLPDS